MEIPAVRRLGYALDFTSLSPFNIYEVDSHIILNRRMLGIDLDDVRDVVINGITYSVPRDVSVTINNHIPQGEYITFPNGRVTADAFAADPSYPLRYFTVSGSSSTDYVAQKFFLDSHQYAFFSYAEGSYNARVDYSKSLSEVALLRGLADVPKLFDPSNATTVNKYRDFFRNHGSHVIHSVNYGARYPLIVWASNEHQDVNKMFNADVKALFNGIPSGGNFDASIKAQKQYKIFLEYSHYLLSISGGGDKQKLSTPDATYADYQTWIKSIKEHDPSLLSVQVVELWTLMKFADSNELKSYADPLYEAFMWFVSRPNVYGAAFSLDSLSAGVEDIPIVVQ